MDLVSQFVDARMWFRSNTLVNPKALTDPTDRSPVEVRQGVDQPFGWILAPVEAAVTLLTNLAQTMARRTPEISGGSLNLQGQKEDTGESGIAIFRRQLQRQVIQTALFANHRRSRRLAGQRLMRRIQQAFTTEMTVRLEDEVGEPVLAVLNAADAAGVTKEQYAELRQAAVAAGRPRILRDLSALSFDVVVSDAPVTPTARALQVQQILEFVKAFPDLGKLMADVLIEQSDLPGRNRILKRIQRFMPEYQAPPAAGPGGPGGVPGGPPVPALPPSGAVAA
jgi:hypothetical protein